MVEMRRDGFLGKRLSHWMVLGACCVIGPVGLIGGMLLTRVYFYGGGKQKWLITTLQTVGWPVLIPTLLLTYYLEARKKRSEAVAGDEKPSLLELKAGAVVVHNNNNNLLHAMNNNNNNDNDNNPLHLINNNNNNPLHLINNNNNNNNNNHNHNHNNNNNNNNHNNHNHNHMINVVADGCTDTSAKLAGYVLEIGSCDRDGNATMAPGQKPGWLGELAAARSRVGTRFTAALLVRLAGIGFLVSADNFLYAYGFQYLPVSTSSLLASTQLAFNAAFAWALVRHRFTAGSVNAVFAITLGAALMGMQTAGGGGGGGESDIPPHATQSQYVAAMAAVVAAAALRGLIFPLVQLVYRNSPRRRDTFCVILEGQIAISAFGTCFSLAGMAASREFSSLLPESRSFAHGPAPYFALLSASAALWQLSLVGSVGLVFSASALLSGAVSNVLFPVVSLLAVAVFRDESFSALKAVSVLLSLWGIVSYAYGGYHDAKRINTAQVMTAAAAAATSSSSSPSSSSSSPVQTLNPKPLNS